MDTEGTFNTESTIVAANTPDTEDSPAVSTATDSSTDVLLKQNPKKWGIEAGPSDFSSKYSPYLSNLEREMATMRDQLDFFITSVRASAVAVQNNESSVIEAVRQIVRNSEERPNEPTRPYGHSADSGNDAPRPSGTTSPQPASAPSPPTPLPSDHSSTGMRGPTRK